MTSPPVAAPAEPAGAWQQMTALLRALAASTERRRVGRLGAALVAVLVINAGLQIAFNAWYGRFFEALADRSFAGFLRELGVFLAVTAGLLAVIVGQTWVQETLKVRLRAWLTDDLADRWLAPGRLYRLGLAGAIGVHPDQRLHEDARKFTEFSADLAAGLLQASLLLVSFVGVLWVLSDRVAFRFGGDPIYLPGYLVWCALAFSLAGSLLTWWVGRPLVPLNETRYGLEAALRFEMVRIDEAAEGVALYRGEADERRRLGAALAAVLAAGQRIADRLARLTWVTSGYGWLGMVAPVLAAAPGYFGGSMTFGELMMVTGAFSQVQQALRWFVDNYARIAEWRAAMMRVASLRDALERLDGADGADGHIRQAPHPQGWLGWRGLTVDLPDGRATLEGGDGDIMPGQTVLVRGDPLAGKSTLFRAIAGLWLNGAGTVLHPPPETMMFLPHRPYLPPGALVEAVTYPSPPSRFAREAVVEAMAALGLSHLAPQLDRAGRWDHDLPLDEQHRLGFVRALLHRPAWLLADDALASLTTEHRTRVMAALRARLPGAAIVVLGRDGTDPSFYDRTLTLVRL